jgi:hypothetical protein
MAEIRNQTASLIALHFNRVNDIGIPGQAGFGVGICPPANLPAGFTPMTGCYDQMSPNYGNYQYLDGSVMVWIPRHYYRIHEGWKTISAATKANPCQLTVTGHGLVTGDKAFVCQVAGMVELNSRFFTVTRVDDNTITLNNTDSSAFTTYTSGGSLLKGVGANYDFNPTIIDAEKNSIDVKSIYDFSTTAAANALGYALSRAMIDGGIEQPGFFVDKYKLSKQAWGSGYIASSLKYGNPLSSASTHNPVADITAAGGSNTYGAFVDAVKGRGETNGVKNAASRFFECSRFIHAALALLATAHGQAALGQCNCAWYNSSTTNFPKGCNSGALKDANDSDVTYTGDGYNSSGTSYCGKTGSGVPFAKTTHNGQECGVADLNGLMYEVALGITCVGGTKTITAATKANPCQITLSTPHGFTTGDSVGIESVAGMTELNGKIYQITVVDATNVTLDGIDSSGYTTYTSAGTVTYGIFYTAKQSIAMKDFTSGASLSTDHWGATGVAAMMDAMSRSDAAAMVKQGFVFAMRYGSGANQVLSGATSGVAYEKTGLGIPKASTSIDATGINLFGTDYYYQYIRDQLCLISCGHWRDGSTAGVWNAYWNYARAYSDGNVGGRAACYPS